jgi:glycosyltransferase involved in cell wall biosynthesis
LNILFITPYLPSENSGHAGAQLIYRNVVGLSEYNKITIASFIDINEENSLDNLTSYGIDVFTINYPRNQKSIFGKINSVFRNIKPLFSYIKGEEPFFIAKYDKKAMSELILKILNSNSFDLIQVEYNVMHHYAHLFVNIKSLIIFHDISTKMYESGSLIGKKSNKRSFRLAKKIESNIANKFDGVVTLTKEDKSYLIKLGCNKKIHIIPPQIKHVEKTLPNKISNSICFVGSFNREPNINSVEIIIDLIFPYINKEITLSIVGKDMPTKLASRINSLDRINYLGFIDDIDSFISSQMLMVAPISIGSGLKMKIPHALSCGTPVITTIIGGEGLEINKEDGIIKSEINNFATEINKLMLNQSKLISLGEKGRDKVNSYFSKEVVVEKFQTLYKSIIKV